MKRRSFIKGLIGGLIAAPISAAVVKDMWPKNSNRNSDKLDSIINDMKITKFYSDQLDRRPCPFRHLVKDVDTFSKK